MRLTLNALYFTARPGPPRAASRGHRYAYAQVYVPAFCRCVSTERKPFILPPARRSFSLSLYPSRHNMPYRTLYPPFHFKQREGTSKETSHGQRQGLHFRLIETVIVRAISTHRCPDRLHFTPPMDFTGVALCGARARAYSGEREVTGQAGTIKSLCPFLSSSAFVPRLPARRKRPLRREV